MSRDLVSYGTIDQTRLLIIQLSCAELQVEYLPQERRTELLKGRSWNPKS